ncbi:MAG: hypothetical protein ACI9UR_002464 [Bacteroidia bacterium]|jgi:hypothetical protein
MEKRIEVKKRVFAFILYACLGITTEVFFTAFVDLITSDSFDNLSLMGYSYIWMFPIYGVTSIVFPIGFDILKKWNRILRYFTYAVAILVVELCAGFLLEQITGSCPWEYQVGWHFGGYIRFDYLPLWMLFGAIIEEFHRFNRSIGIA